MNIRTTLAVAVLAAMGSTAAMAQTSSANMPLTRAEVRQSVIEARHEGVLFEGGDSEEYSQPQKVASSNLARSTVKAGVLAALKSGALVASGESDGAFASRATTTAGSTLTRADVQLATLQARDSGELISAGEGDLSEVARERVQQQYGRTAYLARKALPVVASK